MHAFFYAMPLRRRPLVTAALVSAGAHAALLFGFVKDPLAPPEPVQKVAKEILVCSLGAVEEAKAAAAKSEHAENPDAPPKTIMNHARIAEPPPSLTTDRVIVPYHFDPGQMPSGDSTPGIPLTEEWVPSGPSERVIVDLSDLDKRPEPVVQSPPDYPFVAKNQGIEGIVLVRFVVRADGLVEAATIVSSPHSVLSESALTAVRRWTFRAGVKNGAKVATRMEIPLTFRLGH